MLVSIGVHEKNVSSSVHVLLVVRNNGEAYRGSYALTNVGVVKMTAIEEGIVRRRNNVRLVRKDGCTDVGRPSECIV